MGVADSAYIRANYYFAGGRDLNSVMGVASAMQYSPLGRILTGKMSPAADIPGESLLYNTSNPSGNYLPE